MTRARLLVLGAATLLVFSVATLARGGAPKKPDNERVEAAKAMFNAVKAGFEAGTGTLDAVYLWSVRWLTAQQEPGTAARAPACVAHLTRMRALEATVGGRVRQGLATRTDSLAAAYYRAEAEHWARRP